MGGTGGGGARRVKEAKAERGQKGCEPGMQGTGGERFGCQFPPPPLTNHR